MYGDRITGTIATLATLWLLQLTYYCQLCEQRGHFRRFFLEQIQVVFRKLPGLGADCAGPTAL